MWLIMIGVGIGWAIMMLLGTILLFPVVILLIIVGGVLGGLPALLIGGLASLFLVEGAWPWIVGGVVGIPIFILVIGLPWLFLGGMMEVFKSSTWTLTYRELCALEGLEEKRGEVPELDAPSPE